jgi:hypothetical protein
MAKKEKRHTNHSCYFAAPVLLLAFALQGFLPIVTALSASDPLTEIQTQSRQQQQIRELRQTEQLQQLQRDQQLNNLQQELESRPMDHRTRRGSSNSTRISESWTNSKTISSWTVSKPSSSLIKFSGNQINLGGRSRLESCNVSSK